MRARSVSLIVRAASQHAPRVHPHTHARTHTCKHTLARIHLDAHARMDGQEDKSRQTHTATHARHAPKTHTAHLRLKSREKDLPQPSTGHLNGRSPVCTSMWRLRRELSKNDFPHCGHVHVKLRTVIEGQRGEGGEEAGRAAGRKRGRAGMEEGGRGRHGVVTADTYTSAPQNTRTPSSTGHGPQLREMAGTRNEAKRSQLSKHLELTVCAPEPRLPFV